MRQKEVSQYFFGFQRHFSKFLMIIKVHCTKDLVGNCFWPTCKNLMFGAIGAKDSYGENKNSFGILRQCLTCEDKKMHEFSTEKVTMAMLLNIQVGQKQLTTRSFMYSIESYA